ncbi:hypothetical protein V6N11_081394 [Hibiscus sabdariffa]|uniref:Uncharacterized protein n=1 Tax=Hibiscus sabdariffa TaxID=183260 RepID=A0ABR2QJQ5_9ROSI
MFWRHVIFAALVSDFLLHRWLLVMLMFCGVCVVADSKLFLLPVAALSSRKNSSLALIGFKRLDSDYRLAGIVSVSNPRKVIAIWICCVYRLLFLVCLKLRTLSLNYQGYSTGSGYSQSENQQNQSYHVAHTDHSQRMERPAQVFNHRVGSITPNSTNGYVLSSQNGGFSQPSHVQSYSALPHLSPVYTPHIMGNQFSPGQFTSRNFTSGVVMNFPPATSLPVENGR